MSYLWGIPTTDPLIASDVRIAWDVALFTPAIVGDQTVRSVGAGYYAQRAAGVVIASIVGHCRCSDMEVDTCCGEKLLPVMAEARLAKPMAVAETMPEIFMLNALVVK